MYVLIIAIKAHGKLGLDSYGTWSRPTTYSDSQPVTANGMLAEVSTGWTTAIGYNCCLSATSSCSLYDISINITPRFLVEFFFFFRKFFPTP